MALGLTNHLKDHLVNLQLLQPETLDMLADVDDIWTTYEFAGQ